ncbi:MAG: ATP-binding domain-containing protein, partial [Candidatus Omnitrophica bacterium]|nr:ATP-binding domain-containing protein [Candidatus Omnitrophota bacterium]
SMVRADLLDCIDMFLRRFGKHKAIPFGGVQMIFFGDLYQLPPVVRRQEMDVFSKTYKSPYFFDAKSFKFLHIKMIELHKIYRQKEEDFVRLLGRIRNKTLDTEQLKILNQRYMPQFMPDDKDFFIYLTTTNALADRINSSQLQRIKDDSFFCEGVTAGNFESNALPTHSLLELKIGAQVMLLNNDPGGRWVNGSIGKITFINSYGLGTEPIEVELSNGETVEVTPFTWEMFKFSYNEDTELLESESVGSFKQYPMRLAWAVTIHKAQGKTFSKVVLDIGTGAFSHGQIYVALSRCTTFGGLVLKKPIRHHDVMLDSRIVDFMNDLRREQEVVF